MTEQKKFAANAPDDRKAYHAPKLEDYGEVNELTQAMPVGVMFDSGVSPNNWDYGFPS